MIARLVRALAAGLALVALTIGVPLLLVIYGRSPLDGTGSTWDQLADLPTQAISDNFAFGVLTIAAWASWALFAVNVVSEVITSLMGTRIWRVPGGPFELTARRLVMAVTMSATLATSAGPSAATVPILTSAVSAAPVPDHAAQPPTDNQVPPIVLIESSGQARTTVAPWTQDPAPTAEDGRTDALPMVVVAAGDSPWLLAERHLGNGVRWRELWDLNRGIPQGDGRAWITEDLIRPGWRLTFPADAVDVPALPVPVPAPPSPTGDVPQPAPTLPPPDDEEAASTPPPDGGPATPVAPEQPVGPSSPTTGATVPPAMSTPVDATDPASSDDIDGDDDDDAAWPAPLLGVAGTILAAAVVRELRRHRARDATSRPAGAKRRPPIRVPVDRELLARADEVAASRLDSALSHLAEHLRSHDGQACPQPLVVQVTGERIDVLLDRPQPDPPSPWRPEASGQVWVLDADRKIPPAEATSPLPALVTVGAGDAAILVDLEAFGVVSLVGDHAHCEGLARSIVTELSARNEGAATVEVVGDVIDEDTTRLGGVRSVSTWEDADTDTIGTSSRLLDAGGWPHTWAARASGRIYDGWAPAVWVTPRADHPTYLEAVKAIGGQPGAGNAMVVVGTDPGFGLRIHIDAEGQFQIPDLNLRGEVQTLDQAAAGQLADLLEDADTPSAPETETATALASESGADEFDDPIVIPLISRTADRFDKAIAVDSSDAAADVVPPSDTAYDDPPFDVLVRVCGPIRVDGGPSDLPQRETAVATYVALNGVVEIDRIQDAVWAGTGVSLKRVRNVISTVRSTIGDAISFTPDHRLTTGPGLITDLELIGRRLAHAKQRLDPYREAEVLRGALDLVTGRVCSYPRGRSRCWTWIDLDGWITHVEAIVGSVASQLARVYLELSDGEGAVWAARRGTDAIGRRDELTILEVQGYETLGDEASARSTMRSHERYLNDLGIDEHDDELLALLDRYAAPAHHKTRQ